MVVEPIYLLYGAVFVGVLFMVEGLYLLLADLRNGGTERTINRRLRMMAAGADSREVLHKLRRKPITGEGGLLAFTPIAWLDGVINKAGLRISVIQLVMIMGIATAVLTFVLAQLASMKLPQALVSATMLGTIAPLYLVMRTGKRRLKRFGAQLSDAIDMIVRSLRAGHPVSTAIGLVSREMPDPIGSEFGMVYDEMTYGLDLTHSLQNLADRVPVGELHYMVVAIKIQFGTGGNLADVLGALSRVIRERQRMAAKIKALSAEGRLAATILSALPFLVAGFIWMLNPGYYGAVKDNPTFQLVMGMGLGGMMLGIFIMYKMVNFRV